MSLFLRQSERDPSHSTPDTHLYLLLCLEIHPQDSLLRHLVLNTLLAVGHASPSLGHSHEQALKGTGIIVEMLLRFFVQIEMLHSALDLLRLYLSSLNGYKSSH